MTRDHGKVRAVAKEGCARIQKDAWQDTWSRLER